MKSHKNHSWRRDCRYIQRARAAYGMKSEEEYKPYIKERIRHLKVSGQMKILEDMVLLAGKIIQEIGAGISGNLKLKETTKK